MQQQIDSRQDVGDRGGASLAWHLPSRLRRAGSCFGLVLIFLCVFAATLPATTQAQLSVSIAQQPLFLSRAVTPQVMLNVSNDHQLYFPAYDDYSDLTGDGRPDAGYTHAFDYYGYFDAYKCYAYATADQRFTPVSETADKYCSGQWSGNFLNWLSMARIDTVRKVLYGGMRSTDTAATTVLERSYLPNDAHSWAKYYNGTDLHRLTPFSVTSGVASQDSGITFCNTTRADGTVLSQNVTDPPLIRVAQGNYALWASNERWQCKWYEEQNNLLSGFGQPGSNANDPAISGLLADPDNPERLLAGLGNGLRQGEFVARVEACVDGLRGQERCKRYPDGNLKPVGVLQEYGDDDRIHFGLMTGSYGRNKSGGVLRKNVGSLTNEIRVDTDGTFRAQPDDGGIIATLDTLRIYGYRHDDGTYFGRSGSDDCRWGLASFADGQCSNWGNPQSELFLEALRYFAGASADSRFVTDDSSRIDGLHAADWEDPLSEANYCSPLQVMQFNASTSSHDGDQLDRSGDIGLASATTATNRVGAGEGLHGASAFVGETASDRNQLCTAKTINALGEVAGTCPDAPGQGGTYQIAGLAHHAWTQGVRSDLTGNQNVRTLGVTLAPAVPQARLPIPSSDSDRAVTLLPACRNSSIDPDGNCAIVDFRIVEQDIAGGSGRFYVNWEDSEQGGDFDSDLWGVISYQFDSSFTELTVTTDVVASSTDQRMGFGYILGGTLDGDGFRVHSGIEGFTYLDSGRPESDCRQGCRVDDGPTSATYSVGGGAPVLSLEAPLYYAAKWGGFDTSAGATEPDQTELWDSTGDGQPDNYYFAGDPSRLEEALEDAFLDVLVTSASAAAVATNSTRLDVDAAIYQARFNSARWSGELLAFGITRSGQVEDEPLWNAGDRLDGREPAARRIFTARGLDFADASLDGTQTSDGVNFLWDSFEISDSQRDALRTGLTAAEVGAGLDEARLWYLRGDRSEERTTQDQARPFRQRDSVLGDIVNSNPQFAGTQNFGYGTLGRSPAFDETVGDAYRTFLNDHRDRIPLVVVGSNSGMLHGFDARVDEANVQQGGRELFAYVPAGIYDNLWELTDPDYSHRYFVDGTPRVADAWLGDTPGWRKVVAGTTGAGGRTVFLLDINDPQAMTANDVRWEFRHPRLGNTIGQPSIVALSNGRFGVIVSSGYNNGGNGKVFVIDAADGTLIHTFSTDAQTAGMASPLVLDSSGNGIADRIYVGDMEGRLWRFDMPMSNQLDTRDWGMPGFLEVTGGPHTDRGKHPLFAARDATGQPQPVTAQVEGGRDREGNLMLFFGTGSFFRVGDNLVPSDPQVQSFYGIRDRGQRIHDRTSMTEQEVLAEVFDFDVELRAVSDRELDPNGDGWFLDLQWKSSQGGPGPSGERVNQRAILRSGRIIFTSLVPSANACEAGGFSWLMELNAFTGARIERPVFDLDGDGAFDDGDMIDIVTADGEEMRIAPSGLQPIDTGVLAQPTILSAGEREYKFLSGATGVIETVTERGSEGFGRHSWREMR